MSETTQTQIETQTPSIDDVTLTVVQNVAEVTESPVEELSPLYESINPDALKALFKQPNIPQRRTGMVMFEMADCTVTVTSTGSVSVTDDTDLLTDLNTTHPATPTATADESMNSQSN